MTRYRKLERTRLEEPKTPLSSGATLVTANGFMGCFSRFRGDRLCASCIDSEYFGPDSLAAWKLVRHFFRDTVEFYTRVDPHYSDFGVKSLATPISEFVRLRLCVAPLTYRCN